MKVTVVCFGALREYLPNPSGNMTVVELQDRATVRDVAAALEIPERVLHAVLVDGSRADPSTPVHPGSEVTLMPGFSGGAATQGETT